MIISLLLVQLAICSAILWREIVVNKFRRVATALFFAVYFVVYIVEPLIIHLFYGGPRSIIRGTDIVFRDDYVFFVFNILGICLLFCSWMLSRTSIRAQPAVLAEASIGRGILAIRNPVGLLIPLGFYLFYKSTGLSMGELLVASRFAWFESVSYNPFLAVAGAYLIALSPIYFLLYLESRDRSKIDYFVIFVVILSLVMYGVVTKDRKWIFYLLSGWLASAFLRGGRMIKINPRGAAAIAAVLVVILLSQILRDILPQLFIDQGTAQAHGDNFAKSVSRIFVESDLAYFYSATIEAIHQNVNNGFYVAFGLLRRLFFFFVPTKLSFGLKVEDMSAIFSDVVSGGDEVRRGNMPPGLFGLFVISFGVIASCLAMAALAGLLRLLDLLFLKPMSIVTVNALGFLLVGIVFFFRGDESTVIYFPIFNMFVTGAAVIVARLCGRPAWQR